MSRIVSVWLKSWPIARLLRAQARKASGAPAEGIDPRRPIVLVAPGTGGARLVALNATAWRCGLAPGDLLSNARSKVLELQSYDSDPAADDAALRRLALWCQRYTPVVAPWDAASGADGLFLDITGCAHLFGGEAALLADLARRLRRLGLQPRLAVADTAGAAWAVAQFGESSVGARHSSGALPGAEAEGNHGAAKIGDGWPLRPPVAVRHWSGAPRPKHDPDIIIVPPGRQDGALRELPLAALRLDEEAQATLCRLGFRRIGELMRQPRAPLSARFGTSLLVRLDQALGHLDEPLSPLDPPPSWRTQASFVDAIMTQAHVVEAARRLLQGLMQDLDRAGLGVRVLRLLLFRLDGEVLSLEIGLAAPSRDVQHIARLIAMRLDRLPAGLEADFGFEAAALHVLVAERIALRQSSLGIAEDAGESSGLAALIDRLEHRLGTSAVQRLHPRQSYIPERAVVARRAAEAPVADWQVEAPFGIRPPLLLAPPEEAADVMAIVPEGPPRRFRWRGVLHDVAHADGPERIAPEWWRLLPSPPLWGLGARASGPHRREAPNTMTSPSVSLRANAGETPALPGPARGEEEEPERDYYVVEDSGGRRFWMYRAGRYGGQGPNTHAKTPSHSVVLSDPSASLRTTGRVPSASNPAPSPRWFVHGVFP